MNPTTAKHTALPWRAESRGPALRYCIVDAMGNPLLVTYGQARQKEDAELIVTAVNSQAAGEKGE